MSKHMKRMVFFSFHYNTGSVSLRDGNFLLFILNSSPSLEDYLDLTSLTTCQVPGRIKYSSAGFQWYPKETFYLVIIPIKLLSTDNTFLMYICILFGNSLTHSYTSISSVLYFCLDLFFRDRISQCNPS